jgi:transposase
MAIRLTESERSRVRGMAKRPRSRKQLYRAEALLALDQGQPIAAVARRMRVGVERVEQWVAGFEEKRLSYLAEPDHARPKGRRGDRDAEQEWNEETEEDE